MNNKSKLLKIFLFAIIFIGLNTYSNSMFAKDNKKATSPEEKSDDVMSKKLKGKPEKKKEYKTIEEFLEDGEYISISGFMEILHETEKD